MTTRESALIIIVIILSGALVGLLTNKQEIISMLPNDPYVNKVYAAESEDTVVGYIYKVFSKYGHNVAMKAIECAKSESGLNTHAVGHNKDSVDRGIWQINSKYHPHFTEYFNYKASTDYAEKLFVSRGKNFSAWYGKGCK